MTPEQQIGRLQGAFEISERNIERRFQELEEEIKRNREDNEKRHKELLAAQKELVQEMRVLTQLADRGKGMVVGILSAAGLGGFGLGYGIKWIIGGN